MSFEPLAVDFAREAVGLLDRLEAALLSLEGAAPGPGREGGLGSVRRLLHTLKGNASLVGATQVGALLHALEDVADRLAHDPAAIEPLLSAIEPLRAEAREILNGRAVEPASAAVAALAAGPVELAAAPAVAPELGDELSVAQESLDELLASAGDLVVQGTALKRLSDRRESLDREALRGVADRLEGALLLLRKLVLRIRTVPLAPFLARYQRLVRDEARSQGKRAVLLVDAVGVEVDKAVLGPLAGALVHLLRNAVAHGIEAPSERRAAGKAEAGSVRLAARLAGGRVEVVVSDDGRGLDPEAIAARARRLGLDASRPASELIFAPGLSTAELSSAAGRGVGLDVVHRSVLRLGGSLSLSAQPRQGVAVTLTFPTSLALQQALLCRLGSEVFAVPSAAVVETATLRSFHLRALGSGEGIEHRGRLWPVVDSARTLGAAVATGAYVVLLSAGAPAALRVDALLGQQSFVFQPLAADVAGAAVVSGATLLADGTVVLCLDPSRLAGAAAGASR